MISLDPTTALLIADVRDGEVEAVLALIAAIEPLLAGKRPGIVGAALADLTATWLAGFQPERLREAIWAAHIEQVAAIALDRAARVAPRNDGTGSPAP